MTVGRATVLKQKRGGWVEIYVTDATCIGCHREIVGRFTARPSRLDPGMFDDITCPRCGTRNYARVGVGEP